MAPAQDTRSLPGSLHPAACGYHGAMCCREQPCGVASWAQGDEVPRGPPSPQRSLDLRSHRLAGELGCFPECFCRGPTYTQDG